MLTDDKKRTILALIRDGNARRVAMRCAGYTENAQDYWYKMAAEGKEPYKSFVDEMDQAEAFAESDLVGIVRTAAIEDAKHAQWMLERKFKWWTPRDSAPVSIHLPAPSAPAPSVSDDDIESGIRGGK